MQGARRVVWNWNFFGFIGFIIHLLHNTKEIDVGIIQRKIHNNSSCPSINPSISFQRGNRWLSFSGSRYRKTLNESTTSVGWDCTDGVEVFEFFGCGVDVSVGKGGVTVRLGKLDILLPVVNRIWNSYGFNETLFHISELFSRYTWKSISFGPVGIGPKFFFIIFWKIFPKFNLWKVRWKWCQNMISYKKFDEFWVIFENQNNNFMNDSHDRIEFFYFLHVISGTFKWKQKRVSWKSPIKKTCNIFRFSYVAMNERRHHPSEL